MNEKDFLMQIQQNGFKLLAPEDEFQFDCTGCGECCRNVKNAVMLEPLDLFRLAKHLGISLEETAEKYAEPVMLHWGCPILTLKTRQHQDACVFLRNSRCSVHDCNPRACRLYPLNAGPSDENEGTFINTLDLRKGYHYKGSTHRTSDWMDKLFSDEDREFVQIDCKFATDFGRIFNHINKDNEERVISRMMLYRYFQFDLSEAFLPQYVRNLALLKAELERM